MPILNKLVRDKIPEIIASTGKKFSRVLNEEEYITELKKKSFENYRGMLKQQTERM